MNAIHKKHLTYIELLSKTYLECSKKKYFSLKRKIVTFLMNLEAVSDNPCCLKYKIFFHSNPTMVGRRVSLDL